MVLADYFNREAREAADIDAAWCVDTRELTPAPSTGRSLGTAAMKSSSTGLMARPLPHSTSSLSRPSESPSYFASLTRRASNLASSVGFGSISDISFGVSSNGSLFDFSEAERQKAASILNDAANAASAKAAASVSSTELPTAATTEELTKSSALPPGATRPPYERSNRTQEPAARGRSSSVWSSTASISSVTQRGRNIDRSDTIW